MLTKEKLLSFIKLCKSGTVENVMLVEYYPQFADDSNQDAFDFYYNKGCHNLTEPISKVRICKWISETHDENPSASFNALIGGVMRKSNGRLDPNYVKEVVTEYFKGD
jgi:Asp-tRNA(Asn)/Glu-tRNA(Gln) amidotransferase B subunit